MEAEIIELYESLINKGTDKETAIQQLIIEFGEDREYITDILTEYL